MDVAIAQPLELPASLYVRGRRGLGRRRQRRRYQVARCSRRERSNEARRHPCFRVAVLVIQIIGVFVWSAPPYILQPGSWTPAPDPAVIVRSDCVEIRRIHLFFSLWHDDEALENTTQHRHFFERPLDFDTLHRVLSERLRFA